MTPPDQPTRFFGLSGKGLAIIVIAVIFICVGVSAAALVVSGVASTVSTAITVKLSETPEPEREVPRATLPRTPTTIPTMTPRPTRTSTPTPAPTPTPLPGAARSRPLPPDSIVQANDWEVEVLDVQRGASAAQLIRDANQFNQPAADGQEYVLVKLRLKSLHTDGQSHRARGGDFKLTGDRLTRYLPVGVVPPEPDLEAEVFTGGEIQGWVVYSIGNGEDQLMLDFDPLDSSENRSIFIALQPGTAIMVDASMNGMQPTTDGQTREQPAALGETLVTENWEVSVLEVIRGDRAHDMAEAENQYNDPPDEGLEYLAVRARVRSLDPRDQIVVASSSLFKTIGDKNVLYDTPAIVDPEPALDAYLYPGGEVEGWVILQIGRDEGNAQIVFDPPFDTDHASRRYIALPQ
jgi:hypothetical protein